VYASVQAALLGAALILPFPVAGVANMLAMLVGLVVFTVQIVRVRPRPRLAWPMIAATGWSLVLGAIAASVVYGLRGGVTVSDPLVIVLSALPFPTLAVGLGVLSWYAPRRGPTDVLDALMVALVGFLVLWTLWLGPAFMGNLPSAAIATVLPLGLLVVVAVGVKLVLGGGAAEPPVALVLGGSAALSAAMVSLQVPGFGEASLQVAPVTNLLWALFGVMVGAAGLRPELGQTRQVRGRHVDDASVRRTVLFAGLALVPLAIWAREIGRQPTTLAGRLVPILVSAALLILLVARMGLVARVAHRRAAQLDRRSTALAAAVTQQQSLQRQLAYRATHDPLTDLANRVALSERMDRAFARPRPRGHALLLLDLDRFKDVNDTYGHPVGDRLLIAVADRLRRVEADGVLARLGGDEFAIFLEDTSEAQALAYAGALLEQLRPSYLVDGHEFVITASVGVLATDTSQAAPTAAEVLSDADLALYRAKDLGKDRVEPFRPGLRRGRIAQARLTDGLRHAVARNELLLHYQPIVELTTGRIVAVEALVRWRRPDGQLTPPEEFIPVAEDAGLIGSIGGWVLHQACQDAQRWHADRGVTVFVNIAGRQLDHPGFARHVVNAIDEAGLPSDALVLEITEGSLLTASATDVRYRQLRSLHDNKVRLAIDDFGTGYSSLSYVAKLPVDYVKIDKSLVQVVGGPEAAKGWAFTRAVVEMVASMELTAVGEGVETEVQAQALRATNCALAQGYYFHRPVEASKIDELLRLS
jgi:diguanylate cyclase (GGDEF)-like protein